MSNVNILADAIRSVMNGLEYFGSDISSVVYRIYIQKKKTAEITAEFTEQEKKIIQLCQQKLKSKQIAEQLGISFRTVENHKNHIFTKLGINSTKEMVKYALEHGIIRI
jgi:DNA-binding NarL/FixJ family response regulator